MSFTPSEGDRYGAAASGVARIVGSPLQEVGSAVSHPLALPCHHASADSN